MIFIILGTQKFQLNRLLKQMDDYIENGLIDEEVIAQVGNSDYQPKNYKYYSFFDKKDFDECIQKSSVIITHSS
jgi:UDP-N-acetylglucosamine transferase subunit ALG13